MNLLSKNKNYLKFLPLFQFSTTYIKLWILDEEEMISNLTKTIKDRFNMLINSAYKSIDLYQFSVITSLQKEIKLTYPLLDVGYNKQVSLILFTLKLEISIENSQIISNELQISSTEKLAYLSQIIKNEPYWTDE